MHRYKTVRESLILTIANSRGAQMRVDQDLIARVSREFAGFLRSRLAFTCPGHPRVAYRFGGSSPVHGASPRSGHGPALLGRVTSAPMRWEARLRAFSLCGFSRAPWLKPTHEKPRERGFGYVWRSPTRRERSVNAGPKTAGAAKPRKRGSRTRNSQPECPDSCRRLTTQTRSLRMITQDCNLYCQPASHGSSVRAFGLQEALPCDTLLRLR